MIGMSGTIGAGVASREGVMQTYCCYCGERACVGTPEGDFCGACLVAMMGPVETTKAIKKAEQVLAGKVDEAKGRKP